ncbi:MAG: hypothetical protein IPO48_21105 [Saprospiraceae bacterium]|nr:hypothetical protein [Saprospiraceae bacterium]
MMTFYLMMAMLITRTGGTAGGTVTFNPIPQVQWITYPLASEVSTSVTVIYTVCNPVPNRDVCATATVTINVISSCVTPILKVLLEGPIVDNGSTGAPTANCSIWVVDLANNLLPS